MNLEFQVFDLLIKDEITPAKLSAFRQSPSVLELADKDLASIRDIVAKNNDHGKSYNEIVAGLNLDDANVTALFYLLYYRMVTSTHWLSMYRTRAIVSDVYMSSMIINQF